MKSIQNKELENEAHVFAALLLMPKKFFEEDMKKGLDLGDDKQLRELCRKYCVSSTAFAFRLSLYTKHNI